MKRSQFFLSGALALAAALVLTSCLDSAAPVGKEPAFHHDFASALAEAKNTGKPIVAVFSASWCGPCQYMKKSVYPSQEVQPYHDKFVWAYLDSDEPANQSLLEEYGVQGIPHIAFVSPQGVKLGKVVGGRSAGDFAGELAAILGK